MFRRLRQRLREPLRHTRSDGSTPTFRLPPTQPPTAPAMAEPTPLVERLLAAAATARRREQREPANQEITTIEGRRYLLGDLPEDVQQLLADLLTADELVQQRQQRLLLLQRGQVALLEQLRQGLTAITPMADGAP